jgi:hypothetical protein
MGPVTNEQIEEFAKRVQGLCDAQKLRDCNVYVEFGRRYAKIVKHWSGQTTVWGFVEMATGDILKAASWRGPAKHARGSLHNPDMDIAKMRWTGPPYLK